MSERAFPNVLIPFDPREAMTLAHAARVALVSQTTLRGWCGRYGVGRRIAGGHWRVSRVALAMLLDGDEAALRAYHAGERGGVLVAPYLVRLRGNDAA